MPKKRKSERKALKDLKQAPPFKPTQHMRESVEALAAYAVPQDVIAHLTLNPKTGQPVSERTLQRYFAHELAVGKWKLVAKTAQTLGGIANGSPAVYDEAGRITKAERPAEAAACMFLLKSLGGYVDRVAHQLTDKNGQAASLVVAIVPAEAKL